MGESYQTLYRKWRPMTFADVVGQNHVSDTLRTGISTGRIAHAYLFCGTRGTGKTSTAKIFSRAVNCEAPQNGEPCNQCATCRGILDGSILDVYEMDAASNRGVENIREIRDEVLYTPAGCTYKVYIIDEVHMLTAEAFNALLKTLEEPPKHALFILATTEPHKIPATVLSRCQRFDFRRIGVDSIARRLTQIAEAEGIGATSDALELVAELGDGSMRDALSLLDQCAAFGLDQLTDTKVTEIVGIADPKTLFTVADAIAKADVQTALYETDLFFQQGKEVQNFLEELIAHLRGLLFCKETQDPAKLLEKGPAYIEKLQAQAEIFTIEQLLYGIRILSENLALAKGLSAPRIAAETALVKLCNPACDTSPDGILARISKLEQTIAQGVPVTSPVATESKPVAKEPTQEDAPPWIVPADKEEPSVTATTPDQVSAPTPIEPSHSADTEDEVIWSYWADALQEIKQESKSLFAFLYSAKAFQNGSVIELELGNSLAYDRIAKPEGLAYLSKLFSRISGQALEVQAFQPDQRKNTKADSKEPSILDLAAKKDLLGDTLQIQE